MDANGRREILAKLGMGAAAFVAGSAISRVARGDVRPRMAFNKLRTLKFANPAGNGPGEFTIVTRTGRDGLSIASLSKGPQTASVGYLPGGYHSVHVRIGADNTIELTGLDDILNVTANPCGGSGSGSGGTVFNSSSGVVVGPPPTVGCSTGCTDASGNCITCPPPPSNTGGGGGKY